MTMQQPWLQPSCSLYFPTIWRILKLDGRAIK
jgi:hypothetical protein